MVKRKKKLRLRKEAKRFLVYLVFFLCLLIYILHEVKIIKADFAYKETYEYKILQVGYNEKETKLLLKKCNNKILDYLLDNEYDPLYYEIVKEPYYLQKNFDDYIEYARNYPGVDKSKVIALVNVHASKGWYQETYKADTSKDLYILVNKFYQLDKGYARDDLVDFSLSYSYQGNKAAKEVVEAFAKMHEDVKKELNVHLMVNSSFRPYEDQEEIYKSFKLQGEIYADKFAARPGFSEHQTGLSIDITSIQNPTADKFTESTEYEWLKKNSYKYGFILRFPDGKEDLTGYSTESWHFRYLGKEMAKKVYDSGLTFDEYYAFYIEK